MPGMTIIFCSLFLDAKQYPSVFTITMAALRAKESPGLSSIIPPEVLKSFHTAVQLFDDKIAFGPSLHMMQGILAEAVAKRSKGISH